MAAAEAAAELAVELAVDPAAAKVARALQRWPRLAPVFAPVLALASAIAIALALAMATALLLGAARPAHAAAEGGATVSCPPPLPSVTATTTPEPDRGLLWRLSRDGRMSYLYGTLHVGKPAWRRFGPQVAAALRQTDVLALEIDPADPALLQALGEADAPLVLPSELQARLTRAHARACIAPAALAGLRPLLQATTLAVLEARWLGMDPGHAMELLLAAHARSLGRRVVALETAAQQKAALLPTDPATALAALEHSLAQLEDHSGRRVLAALTRAWEHGDLAVLEDVDSWCECSGSAGKAGSAGSAGSAAGAASAAGGSSAAGSDDRAFLRRLNDERNPQLADGIEAQHRQGRRVFAAVGALHMTGPSALPLLLARRGFRVERVGFAR